MIFAVKVKIESFDSRFTEITQDLYFSKPPSEQEITKEASIDPQVKWSYIVKRVIIINNEGI